MLVKPLRMISSQGLTLSLNSQYRPTSTLTSLSSSHSKNNINMVDWHLNNNNYRSKRKKKRVTKRNLRYKLGTEVIITRYSKWCRRVSLIWIKKRRELLLRKRKRRLPSNSHYSSSNSNSNTITTTSNSSRNHLSINNNTPMVNSNSIAIQACTTIHTSTTFKTNNRTHQSNNMWGWRSLRWLPVTTGAQPR